MAIIVFYRLILYNEIESKQNLYKFNIIGKILSIKVYPFLIMPNLALGRFSGNHHEIGIQQGRTYFEQFKQTIQLIPRLSFIKTMKPKFIPTPLFIYLAKRRASSLLKHDILQYYPLQAERLNGIAEGSETDPSTLLLMQL